MSNPDLTQLRRDLESSNQETRGRAMQALVTLVKRGRDTHAWALGWFENAILNPADAWSASSAARGIAVVSGSDAGHRARLALLHHQREDVAARAALEMTDPEYTDDLIRILSLRAEARVCSAVIRTLGRMRRPAAFEAIAQFLDRQDTRADAIQALGELGDVRAIPLLEAQLEDHTELWLEDTHGPMLRVCDLARDTIGLLRAR